MCEICLVHWIKIQSGLTDSFALEKPGPSFFFLFFFKIKTAFESLFEFTKKHLHVTVTKEGNSIIESQ